MIVRAILVCAAGYLLGCVTFGYFVVRWMGGGDLRTQGSGNVGATNVLRTQGKLAALATMTVDVGKGAAAVWIARLVLPGEILIWGLAGLAAVLGHMFPFWLGFRGGKGVATGLGVFLVLSPLAVLLATAIFIAIAALLRFVSLGSILSSAALPALMHFVVGSPRVWVYCAVAAAILIVAKHHANIRRLIAGTEPRLGASSV